jgi:hypothetical protein
MVLRQLTDGEKMGALLMYVSETLKLKYIFAVCRRGVVRDRSIGSTVELIEMEGVENLQQAREWCDRHPMVVAAKIELMKSLGDTQH